MYNNISNLKRLNQIILRNNIDNSAFHLYTADQKLKTYFTPTGEVLDNRNDLLLFRENKGINFH
jgi:hypothetical protein